MTLTGPELDAYGRGFDRHRPPSGDDAPPEFASPLALGQHLDRRILRTPALDLVDAAMLDVIEGRCDRLMVILPPQEGKTSALRFACTLALQRDPWLRIGVAAYSDRRARRVPRQVRDDILAFPRLGLRVAADYKAMYDWRLTNREGGMFAAGRAGAWSGEPIHLLGVDDMFKDRADADSPATRERVWEWWTSTGSARLSEGGRVVMAATAWHHDDLRGRLLRDDPGGWRVVHIPAQADPEVLDPDPLGRAAGEFMVSALGRTEKGWQRRKREAAADWDPVYQGSPQAPGGEFFAVDKLRYWREPREDSWAVVCGQRVWRLDQDCWIFATVDPAGTATKAGNDWTVVGVWAVPIDGSLVLLDLARARIPGHRHMHLARPLIERWGVQRLFVEPTLRSTQLVREAAARGWPVEDLIADKSKEVRAQPLAQRVDDGMVWLPAGHPLLAEVVRELREFPLGSTDDIVDVCSYAAAVNYRRWAPPMPAPAVRRPTVGDVIGERATSVPAGFDPARAQF